MKKWQSVTATVLCALGLAACANSTASTTSSTQAESGVSKASEATVTNVTSDNQATASLAEAPQFTLKDLDGNEHRLSDYRGKKVYVKFWASWCSVCLAGLADVDKLAAEQGEDFVVLSVVTPGVHNEKSAQDFTEWFRGIDRPNLTVLLGENRDLLNQYHVRAYPTAAYIDSEGQLVDTVVGHQSYDDIKNKLNNIN